MQISFKIFYTLCKVTTTACCSTDNTNTYTKENKQTKSTEFQSQTFFSEINKFNYEQRWIHTNIKYFIQFSMCSAQCALCTTRTLCLCIAYSNFKIRFAFVAWRFSHQKSKFLKRFNFEFFNTLLRLSPDGFCVGIET